MAAVQGTALSARFLAFLFHPMVFITLGYAVPHSHRLQSVENRLQSSGVLFPFSTGLSVGYV